QFALTIAASTLISTFNSLTLSPALCALLLKGPGETSPTWLGRVVGVVLFPLTFLGGLFNRGFAATGRWYVKVVGFGLRVPLLVLAGYLAIIGAGVAGFQTMPTGFIPQQDKGYLVCSIQLPDSASAERTQAVISEISRIALAYTVEIPAREGEPGAEKVTDADGERWVRKVHPVRHVNAVAGNSFVLSA